VKPLERCQLKNWKEYLDYEIEQGDQERIIILFERCLIACALYEEFWIKVGIITVYNCIMLIIWLFSHSHISLWVQSVVCIILNCLMDWVLLYYNCFIVL
jgi:hypothetical protein